MPGKRRVVTDTACGRISLAHSGSIPKKEPA
jgi:hypothetical protein